MLFDVLIYWMFVSNKSSFVHCFPVHSDEPFNGCCGLSWCIVLQMRLRSWENATAFCEIMFGCACQVNNECQSETLNGSMFFTSVASLLQLKFMNATVFCSHEKHSEKREICHYIMVFVMLFWQKKQFKTLSVCYVCWINESLSLLQ